MDDSFLYADFAAACVLVSFCVLMSKLTFLYIIILSNTEVKDFSTGTRSYSSKKKYSDPNIFLNRITRLWTGRLLNTWNIFLNFKLLEIDINI